jgi:tRNA1(Val) A37 N6-methylase TrmN6
MNDTGNITLDDADLVLNNQDFPQLNFNFDTDDLDFVQLNCLTPPYNDQTKQQIQNYTQSM